MRSSSSRCAPPSADRPHLPERTHRRGDPFGGRRARPQAGCQPRPGLFARSRAAGRFTGNGPALRAAVGGAGGRAGSAYDDQRPRAGARPPCGRQPERPGGGGPRAREADRRHGRRARLPGGCAGDCATWHARGPDRGVGTQDGDDRAAAGCGEDRQRALGNGSRRGLGAGAAAARGRQGGLRRRNRAGSGPAGGARGVRGAPAAAGRRPRGVEGRDARCRARPGQGGRRAGGHGGRGGRASGAVPGRREPPAGGPPQGCAHARALPTPRRDGGQASADLGRNPWFGGERTRRAVPTGSNRSLDTDGHRSRNRKSEGRCRQGQAAVNLAASIADAGYPTLLVDLDPQCNATVALGLPKDSSPNIYDCLSGSLSLTEAALASGVERLDVVASTPDLAGANVELPRIAGSETILRGRLGSVRERYLFTLLDCPPSLGPITVNALVAADKVIVPVQTEYFALEGLAPDARHALAHPARAQPAPYGRRHDPHDARRTHPARARRRARGPRALP